METSVIKGKRNHKRVISSVGASMAMEGLQPSLHAQALGKLYLEDKITGREAITRIKERHSAKFELSISAKAKNHEQQLQRWQSD